jgi:hypothetical protein
MTLDTAPNPPPPAVREPQDEVADDVPPLRLAARRAAAAQLVLSQHGLDLGAGGGAGGGGGGCGAHERADFAPALSGSPRPCDAAPACWCRPRRPYYPLHLVLYGVLRLAAQLGLLQRLEDWRGGEGGGGEGRRGGCGAWARGLGAPARRAPAASVATPSHSARAALQPCARPQRALPRGATHCAGGRVRCAQTPPARPRPRGCPGTCSARRSCHSRGRPPGSAARAPWACAGTASLLLHAALHAAAAPPHAARAGARPPPAPRRGAYPAALQRQDPSIQRPGPPGRASGSAGAVRAKRSRLAGRVGGRGRELERSGSGWLGC